jgi:hypothetical protein
MKKLLWKILAVLVILIVIVFLARNAIARKAVEVGAKRITGFPLEIGSVNLGLFSSKVDVHDVKLMNPSEFQDKLFVDMPQLYVDYQFGSMLSGAPHINDMLINIKQLVVVKNNKGDSNAMKLKGVVSSGGSSSKKYRVDKLRIHVGTVTLYDHSRTGLGERQYPLNIDATYSNITDSTDITRLVLLTVMSQVRLPDIGVSVNDLKKNLGDVSGNATKVLQGATENLDKAGKGFGDSLKQLIPNSNNK